MIKQVRKHRWTTLEWFLGTSAEIVISAPPGTGIRVKFGIGWLSFTRQYHLLGGDTSKRLHISGLSILLARVQVYSPDDTGILYKLFFQMPIKRHYRKIIKSSRESFSK